MSLPTITYAERAFDVYDGEDIHGSRLIRLTKDDLLEGTSYRHTYRPAGSGRIVVQRSHAARQYLLRGNYVRAVNLSPVGGGEEVDGGFFLDEGEEIVLSDKVTKAYTIGGPGQVSYYQRAHLDNVSRSPSGGSGDQNWIDTTGDRVWWGPGLRQGFDNIAKRLIVEAWLLPDNPIPAVAGVIGDFATQVTAESLGAPEGQWRSPVAANLWPELQRLLEAGALDIWMDPDTFRTRFVDFDDLAIDRTGGAFGAGVVRFEAGINIAADLRRAIHHSNYCSHLIVHTPDRLLVTVVEDPDWTAGDPVRYGELEVDVDGAVEADLITAGLADIELRKLETDEPSFPILYGDDEAAGLYTPSDLAGTGHVAPGNYVTLHTGSGAGDFNEQTIQVAAVNWVIAANGLFIPWIELGSQYSSTAQAALDRRLGGIGTGGCRCPVGCDLAINVLPVVDGSSIKVSGEWSGVAERTNANDADDGTVWSESAGDLSIGVAEAYWAADLAAVTEIDAYRILQLGGDTALVDNVATEVRIYGANDSAAWAWLTDGSKIAADPASNGWALVDTFNGPLDFNDTGRTPFADGAVSYRYWLFRAVSGGTRDWDVEEFELWSHGLNGTSPRFKRCDALIAASDVRVIDAGNYFDGRNAEEVFQELGQTVAMATGLVTWFNIQDYGAIEDDSTDCQAAVNSAIAAMISAGGGVLYAPGTGVGYRTSGGFSTLSLPCTVMGDGKNVTKFTCTSTTADLFTVTSSDVHMRDMGLYFSGTTTAGAAIHQTTACITNQYERLRIQGAWVGLYSEAGYDWSVSRCYFEGIRKYGIRINHSNPDSGDPSITGCLFSTSYSADAALRVESGGGVRFSDNKVNGGSGVGYAWAVDYAWSSGSSVIAIITGNSLENTRTGGIRMAFTGGSYKGIIIDDNEYGFWSGSGQTPIVISASGGATVSQVIIDNQTALGAKATYVVNLTGIDHATVSKIEHDGFTGKLTSSGCTNLTDNTSAGGVTDHGALTGLADDDHTQYTKKATLTAAGDLYYASGAATPARRAIGSEGQVLRVVSGLPQWGSSPGDGLILVDGGTTDYSAFPTVTLTSVWGIDSGGTPYYNAAGVTSGEEAALLWDPATNQYLLRAFDF